MKEKKFFERRIKSMIVENDDVQGKVEILSHESILHETFNVVCSYCLKAYTWHNVKTYKNCKVRYEDGTVNEWGAFYVVTKELATCSHCGYTDYP